MISSLLDHLIGIVSPHIIILSTAPHIWSFVIPYILWLWGFSIRSKIGKSTETILTLIILFLHIIIEESEVRRKSQNNVLFYLFIAWSTRFVGHFNVEDLIWHFYRKTVELSHLFTVLLTHFWVTRAIAIWSDSFFLPWNL